MTGYELIDKYKNAWFENLPAGSDWPLTDDATDEAIQREFSQRGLASDDEDQVGGVIPCDVCGNAAVRGHRVEVETRGDVPTESGYEDYAYCATHDPDDNEDDVQSWDIVQPNENNVSASEREYRDAVFSAMGTWHHPNAYATRSNDSITYDYKSIERDLIALGATEPEADVLVEVLHVEGWGGVEDSSNPQLANMLEWLRENRPVRA